MILTTIVAQSLLRRANAIFERYRNLSLIIRIIAGLIVGVALGVLVPSWHFIGIFGQLFVGALKGIAPILVFFIIMTAISKFERGDNSHIKTIVVMYVCGTVLSAALGIIASFMFRIKLILPEAAKVASPAPKDLGTVLSKLFVSAVSNPIAAMTDGNYLSILFWALVIGAALRHAGTGTKKVLTDFTNAVGRAASFIIEFAPIGVAGLLYDTVSNTGFAGIAKYTQLVLLLVATMAVAYLGLYAFMVWLATRQNPFPLTLWTLKESGIPAFFTRSGAVNIPINLGACKKLGLSEKSYAISIPLGASANSGGAAITIAIMTLAACFTLGVHVTLPLAIILCLLTALASTGVSGIAGGSLLIIPMAASIFGISNDIAMQVVGIGFIIGVIQDAVETAVNSAADLLFTAAGEYHDLRKAGTPVDMNAVLRKIR